MEKERVVEFLSEPNKELDEVCRCCGQILNKEPLPSIWEVFVEVWRRESRRSVMMGGSSSTIVTGNSTLASATTEAANFAG